MFYPGRGMRGARAQRSANMNFSSGPSTVPAFSNVVGSTTSSVSQMRDAMDPIAGDIYISLALPQVIFFPLY